jgi:hypothetical protein
MWKQASFIILLILQFIFFWCLVLISMLFAICVDIASLLVVELSSSKTWGWRTANCEYIGHWPHQNYWFCLIECSKINNEAELFPILYAHIVLDWSSSSVPQALLDPIFWVTHDAC